VAPAATNNPVSLFASNKDPPEFPLKSTITASTDALLNSFNIFFTS
jgi:hypothetical protein